MRVAEPDPPYGAARRAVRSFPPFTGSHVGFHCTNIYFSVYTWLPRLLRHLPFVRHCIVLAYPRLCLPLASPLGSCNSAFYQRRIHFHQHQTEFLCIQYLSQKEDFRGAYTLLPFALYKHYTKKSLRSKADITLNLVALESYSPAERTHEDSRPEATRMPRPPASALS